MLKPREGLLTAHALSDLLHFCSQFNMQRITLMNTHYIFFNLFYKSMVRKIMENPSAISGKHQRKIEQRNWVFLAASRRFNVDLEPDQSRNTHQFPVASRSASTALSTHHRQIKKWNIKATKY